MCVLSVSTTYGTQHVVHFSHLYVVFPRHVSFTVNDTTVSGPISTVYSVSTTIGTTTVFCPPVTGTRVAFILLIKPQVFYLRNPIYLVSHTVSDSQSLSTGHGIDCGGTNSRGCTSFLPVSTGVSLVSGTGVRVD